METPRVSLRISIASQRCALPARSPRRKAWLSVIPSCKELSCALIQSGETKLICEGMVRWKMVWGKKTKSFTSWTLSAPLCSQLSEGVKKLLMNSVKAAELVEPTERSPVLRRDCPLCSTECCISSRQRAGALPLATSCSVRCGSLSV